MNNIYKTTIYVSIVFIILSLFMIIFNVFNIPIEALIGVLLFSSIGAISFSIELRKFNKEQNEKTR